MRILYTINLPHVQDFNLVSIKAAFQSKNHNYYNSYCKFSQVKYFQSPMNSLKTTFHFIRKPALSSLMMILLLISCKDSENKADNERPEENRFTTTILT